MPTCFVIQPFDGGPFDKRFEDTLAPAITAAGVEPYRVDRDDSAVVPIQSIQEGIRRADVCLADISTDNPNIWFEVGFAIAMGKHIELVCSHERQKFPFDVQHRTIIRYKTQAQRDFESLAERVTRRLKAAIAKQNEIASIEDLEPIANREGLSSHEIVALVIIAQELDRDLTSHMLRQNMGGAGYTDIAIALAVRSLGKKQFIAAVSDQDFNGNEFNRYQATEAGYRWLENNQNKLTLNRKTRNRDQSEPGAEDIPF
jgi:nucleoside 2-deoxyribosyltransferase